MHPPSVVDPAVDPAEAVRRDLRTAPFLVAARGGTPSRRPVWFMRQAGRSLPEYRALRAGTAMLQACLDPALTCEITLQPVRRHGVDAAILFSDIVVPLYVAGIGVDIVPGTGPVVAHPVRTAADVAALPALVPEQVAPVAEAVGLLLRELGDTPLIGFAGAPFTLASYLVEGGPSRNHERTKALMYSAPDVWHALMGRLADLTADVPAGADRGGGRRGAALRLLGGRAVRAGLPPVRPAALHPRARGGRGRGRAADPLRRGHRRAARCDGGGGRRRRRRRLAGAARRGRPPHRPTGAGQPRPGRAVRRPGRRSRPRCAASSTTAATRRATCSTWATACFPRPTRTSSRGWSNWCTAWADEGVTRVAVVGAGIAGSAPPPTACARCSAPTPRSRCWSSATASAACCAPWTSRAGPMTSAPRRSSRGGPRCRRCWPSSGWSNGSSTRRGRTRRSARRGARWRCPAARCWACRRARPGWRGCSRTPGSRRWRPSPDARWPGRRAGTWRSARCCGPASATS